MTSRLDRQLESSPRNRWRRRLIVTPIVLVATLVIGVFAYARLAWNAWPWQYSPSQITACGRHFQRADLTSRAALDAQGAHLVRVGTQTFWFDDRPLWGEDVVSGQRLQLLPGGCSVVLYLQESSDSYRSYDLEGGP